MTKTALVTGGTRGIGKAISLALKEAGHTVVANYAGNDDAARAFTEETGIEANVVFAKQGLSERLEREGRAIGAHVHWTGRRQSHQSGP